MTIVAAIWRDTMARESTPGQGQSLLAAYKRAREARDPDAAMAMFSEDIEYRFDPFEPPLRGHLEVRAYWNALVASQTEVEFDAGTVWVVGRTVLCDWHAGYDVTDVDVRIRARGFMTMEVNGKGRVRRVQEWGLTEP
jgi:hypothetical protein